MNLIKYFTLFFVLINLFTYFLYYTDKKRAIQNKWRIRESTLIFFTLSCGGIGAFFARRFLRHKTEKSKFKFFGVIGIFIAITPIIHIAHSLTLDRIIVFREITFYDSSWPSNLNGYRIAFLTDMHTISHERMAEVVNELNSRDIDLLLLGGDFSSRNYHYRGSLREIANTIATDGIFGVEGNHDSHESLFYYKRSLGITPLNNTGYYIHEGFFVAGVHDMWNRTPNIELSTVAAGENSFILLVSHNPDVTMSQNTNHINLTLSGHTHGGQITLFGWAFHLHLGFITNYGTRFTHSFAYSYDKTPVYTSSGVGDYYGWPRIFARPEVVIFTMYEN